VCSPACASYETCCGTTCVDLQNDPQHCGACDKACTGTQSYCGSGHCGTAPCNGQTCGAGQTCCGTQCCTSGQICCLEIGTTDTIACYTPTAQQPSCPVSCGACLSDRNVKRDFEPVDTQSVLARVAQMPITTWSYKSDDPSVRHMGMMAQDFHEEFGLGSTDKAFNPVDAHGVEMAAIQALYARIQDQDARIQKLEAENAQLRKSKR
jgi:hypothetical protein